MDRPSAAILKKIEVPIDLFASERRPIGCKKLNGKNEYLWRIRVGGYKVKYSIADKLHVIDVRWTRYRKDVYK